MLTWTTPTSICGWPASQACTPSRCWTRPRGRHPAHRPSLACLPLIPDPEIASPAHLEAVGRALWRCAFGAGQVAGLWRASLATAAAAGSGLRLRLAVESAALAAMPWELLCDDALGRFLALDPGTPVVRYVRLPFAAGPWPQGRAAAPAVQRRDAPGSAASPGDRRGRGRGGGAGRADPGRPPDANRHPDAAPPCRAWWPRSGRAWTSGISPATADQAGLVFDDGAGRAAVVEAGTLGLLLAGEGVRLAVLNACRAGLGGGQATSVAGALVRAGVPAVIAMQGNLDRHGRGSLGPGPLRCAGSRPAGGPGVDRGPQSDPGARRQTWPRAGGCRRSSCARRTACCGGRRER